MIMHADDAHDEAMQAGELTANLSCNTHHTAVRRWTATSLTIDTTINPPTSVDTKVARTMDT